MLPLIQEAGTVGAFVDLTGQRVNRWTVLGKAGKNKQGNYLWLCRCDCGTERVVASTSLRQKTTVSCGCYHTEVTRAKFGTHLESHKTPEFDTWCNIRQRCCNESSRDYPRYGGRGITVCDRWLNSYEAFLEDMGRRPTPHHTIERIDNDGPYSPENCRWATRREQANNTRRNRNVTCRDETHSIAEWSRISGTNSSVIWSRLSKGLPPEEAIFGPPQIQYLSRNRVDGVASH